MILTKLCQYVNEMMTVAVKKFLNFLLSRFLIIRQNVSMATNSILYCGMSPILRITGELITERVILIRKAAVRNT